jgi:Methyltransferase domain
MTGSQPEFYDRFLVPVLFEPFANDMASRVGTSLASGDLLEIAAGTGILTRALVRALSPAVNITATDLNPAILARAQTHAGLERVTWREADALALPFHDQTFDCVVCRSDIRLRRMPIRHSIASYASSGSCFFRTSARPSARRCGSCGLAADSCSVYGAIVVVQSNTSPPP